MDRLEQITDRFQYLEAAMAAGDSAGDIAALAKEYSDLRPVVEQISAYKQLLSDMDEAREMLQDPDAQFFVASLCSICRSLGTELIAQAIETPEQAQLLGAAGVAGYQGYAIQRPVLLGS